ncbi:MAG: metalloregulator ArsR/SmtB family transcription factor [Planctomycetes bacterium]|jgi:DNA-binding transcriptional ArsR family regulator|nr:metalloregulator ArsR/SmtB family transcription factor [Planctomycetota bacterium]
MNEPKELARLLKVPSVGMRVRIVQLLKGRALCVNALALRLDVTQGAVSQHLRIMRDAGLVVDEKRGYFVHYRLNEDTLAAWREEIDRLLDLPDRQAGPTRGVSTDTKGAPKCAAMRDKKAARSRKT